MTDDLARLLDELEQAHAKATPGPWRAEQNERLRTGCMCMSCWEPIEGSWDIDPVDGPDCPNHGCWHNVAVSRADAEFIALAHNALPTLIAELRRRDEAIQAVRELAEEHNKWARINGDLAYQFATRAEREQYHLGMKQAQDASANRIRAALNAYTEQAEEATP